MSNVGCLDAENTTTKETITVGEKEDQGFIFLDKRRGVTVTADTARNVVVTDKNQPGMSQFLPVKTKKQHFPGPPF